MDINFYLKISRKNNYNLKIHFKLNRSINRLLYIIIIKRLLFKYITQNYIN